MTGQGRRLLRVLAIGTIPAVVVGLTLRSQLERLNDTPRAVAVALVAAGGVLLLAARFDRGSKTVGDVSAADAGVIGIGQALALIPGVTRSGMTIGAGASRSLSRHEAARFAFLLGVPIIAGTGLLDSSSSPVRMEASGPRHWSDWAWPPSSGTEQSLYCCGSFAPRGCGHSASTAW